MPELQCEVYDNILSGFSNSLLGVFSIDVKRIIKRTQAQVIEDINQADRNNGLAFAQNFLLNQLNNVGSRLNSMSSKSNNIIDNGGGMKENNIDNDNDNIISTNVNKNDQELLNISQSINKKGGDVDPDDENANFLEEDENKYDDKSNGEINLANTNLNSNMVFTIAPKEQKVSSINFC